MKVEFSEYELEVIRFCAKKYNEPHGDYIGYAELPRFQELGKSKIIDLLDRMTRLGLLNVSDSDAIRTMPRLFERLQEIDNPPPRDRWDEATKWFRSKWWSLPVLVLLVGLPALKGWVDVIKGLLEWTGITPGGSSK